jgi:tetratricopeptide (TPR) repeat protein
MIPVNRMAEGEEITYTPEELVEIERIVNLVEKSGRKIVAVKESAPPKTALAVEEPEEEAAGEPEIEEEYHTAPESFEEPEDLALPSVDLDQLTGKKTPVEEEIAPVEDITGLIHEVGEAPEIKKEDELLEDLTKDLREITGKAIPGPVSAEKPVELNTLDELDHLTLEEPESLDTKDRVQAKTFIEEKEPPRIKDVPRIKEAPRVEEHTVPEDMDTGVSVLDEEPSVADLDALDIMEKAATPIKKPPERVSLHKEPETGIPDLSDISFDEKVEMPEAHEADIPEIDIGAAGAKAAIPAEKKPAAAETDLSELTDEDLASIKSVIDSRDEPAIKPTKQILSELKKKETVKKPEKDLDIGIPDLPAFEEDSLEVDMIEEKPGPARPGQAALPDVSGIDLSERDLKRLTKAMLLFNTPLRQSIKDTVMNDLIPEKDARQLISMILSGRPEDDIHKYLEGKLKKKIPIGLGRVVPGRRVITSRPEYAIAGRERQKRLLIATKIFGAAAVVTCVLIVIGYQFLYKPNAAGRMIREGAALIRETGDYLKKPKDYAKAENIFRDVDNNYVRDFAYGYTEYARAYFDKKEYTFSIEKLNKLYTIQNKKGQAYDFDLLNNLGYVYSKVPSEYYNTVRLNINQWYYPGSDKKREEWSQLDVVVEFYRRVLVRDKNNITALFGVGNAYFFQGQYFKAKKYYEDIISVEPDSEVGYSGLLNLYIERNVLEQVIDVHSRLAEKKLLDKVPPALLAKLASYYLDKQKSAASNVRIDYGVQSPRFKDDDDNIFPAVYGVLEALNKRNKDYPPLHLQYARLNRAQNNLKLMKIHLEKAIKLSKDNYNADYFGALHLLGDYYYQSKEPVKAYETLNRAIKAAENPPEFTHEDFYKETENVGKSYAMLGNIFYYFFDKLRMRYGDLEDEAVDQETDKMSNYQIARDKYEKALEEKFESSEVHYNLGRIYYLNKLYQKALDQWLNLYEDFAEKPEIMFALGNAFYHMGSYDAAKGEYLKLISAYEYELEKMKIPRRDLEGHVKVFTFLSAAYNNMGVVYQSQNNEAKSDISYWKAIDYAQKINTDNEFARVNLARSFKRTGASGEGILDESIPYSIDYYREDMRK